MKNLTGNKIGNVVNLMLDGNAYHKTFETNDEANHFYGLMIKARKGDDEALQEILVELNRRYLTVIKGILEKDEADNYYLKGIGIKMPELLANTFVDYLNNDFPVDALVNFWKLLVTNPDPRVREDLFVFLQQYNFSITDNGYFIAYKAVLVKQETDLDIASFVSNQYVKIKTQKRSPANYQVVKTVTTEDVPNPNFNRDVDERDYDDDEDEDERNDYSDEPEFYSKEVAKLILVKNDATVDSNDVVLGNLGEMFAKIDQLVDNRTIYESKHSGKNGRIEQVLGVPVKMDRDDTDLDPTVECSTGLHVGSTRYVENFSSYGDRILLTLVNPAHVVAVPKYDKSKMRTCEYFPYAELERLEGNKFEVIESPYFETDYMKYEKSDLENQIEKIQAEIDQIGKPTDAESKELLNYKKILEDRLISIEEALAY